MTFLRYNVFVKTASLLRWDLAAVAVGVVLILAAFGLKGYTANQTAAVAQPQDNTPSATTTKPTLYPYIEVVTSCGPYYGGEVCVNMRSGPGTNYPVVAQLRKGMVLRVAETVTNQGREWYRIAQDSELRFPERVGSDWFVAADVAYLFYDDGDHRLDHKANETTLKNIVVDLSDEMLYAYEGDQLFMKEPISTGLELTPTAVGTFTVYKMTPSRYMQGPIEGLSDQFYDLPGVPWNLYFTKDGAVIHGAYWHDHFGQPWSHGCVNLSPENAKKLYFWADIGTTVTVRN